MCCDTDDKSLNNQVCNNRMGRQEQGSLLGVTVIDTESWLDYNRGLS
jgi:hypothetical protein